MAEPRLAAYEIREADPVSDRAHILEVWNANLKAHSAAQHEVRYDWTHRAPTGGARHWLAFRDGRPVGTAGLNLRQVAMHGKTLLAGLAVDFAVDRMHRLMQPALSLQKAVFATLNADVHLIYGLPAMAALPVFERQGYKRVGVLRRYVKVLRTKRFLQAAGGAKKKLAHFSSVIDVVAWLRSAETWRGLRAGRSLQRIDEFDAQFDELFSRLRGLHEVIGIRDARFLRWRYSECPLQLYETLGLFDGGRLVGYVTWYGSDDQQHRVVDFMTDGADGAAEDLLVGLNRIARQQGAASIAFEFFGGDALEPCLRRFGFVSRESNIPLIANAANAETFDPLSHWYFTRGDENVNTR